MFERYYPQNWPVSYDGLIHTAIALGVATFLALALHWIVFKLLGRVTRASASRVDDTLVVKIRKPMRWAMIAFGISIAAENDALIGDGWDVLIRYLMPAVIGWVAFSFVKGLAAGLVCNYEA